MLWVAAAQLVDELLVFTGGWLLSLIKWPPTRRSVMLVHSWFSSGVNTFVRVCVCTCRFSLVWESSSWRRRWRRSRLGIATRAASPLSATTPSKPTLTEVRKVPPPLFWSFCSILLPFSVVSVGINWRCSMFSDPTSPTKTNSLPGYRSNGLHRVSTRSPLKFQAIKCINVNI